MLPLWDAGAPQPPISISCSGALPSNHALAASGTGTLPDLPHGVFIIDTSLHGPQGCDAPSRVPVPKHSLLWSGMERQHNAEVKCLLL